MDGKGHMDSSVFGRYLLSPQKSKRQKEDANQGLLEWCMCIISHAQLLVMPARILCPWGFPGKNIGVRCHALL